MRSFAAVLAIGVVLASGDLRAQATPVPEADADVKHWSFAASAFTYLLPADSNYLQPTLASDRGWLHLEGRYNYEALKTGSAWLGYNWSVGKTVTLDLTPMIGGVFGETTGIAPGYEASIGWRTLELSSESEYVFDTGNSADSFFYTWSELGWAPMDWFRAGLAVQRTKVYESDFDIQRGFLVGVSYRNASVTTYVFDPDAKHPTVVIGVEVTF